eukprot:CAMPEP_0173224886 /NCGR_PEP_ID=MMETSP1142-20121109/4589_1 /TAXON_ID=483371 /ORGANISM="non described non described, Strain CCMP2298" /LENGTH=143 /DNA_ID=CAMNT_0014153205 /DNA_START=706 /DNA_END=1138 /DNA_ORIENTATION=+
MVPPPMPVRRCASVCPWSSPAPMPALVSVLVASPQEGKGARSASADDTTTNLLSLVASSAGVARVPIRYVPYSRCAANVDSTPSAGRAGNQGAGGIAQQAVEGDPLACVLAVRAELPPGSAYVGLQCAVAGEQVHFIAVDVGD